MMHEDSNGDTGFEIVEKKTDELSTLDSSSSMSSSASLIPSPGVPVSSVPGGNLLSSVPPPSELPSFIAQTAPPQQVSSTGVPPLSVDKPAPTTTEPFFPTTFSPAIPPSKGIQSTCSTTGNALPPLAQQLDTAGGTSGLFGWMKDAVSSGGILSKVAEKAKNSVDSMITTLDPQMREFIYSGGDMDILVASDKEVKIRPIREAFQCVFGKATVEGMNVECANIAAQPVGFAAGVAAAEERIASMYAKPHVRPVPVVAVENFLVEIGEEKWFDVGVLILNDPTRQINLQTFTQMTPVSAGIVSLAQEDTPVDYPLRCSGFSVTIGSLMASNLHVDHSQWHQALTGVSRREMIQLAAKTLAGLYKNALNQN
ncbi:hypothetical protein CBL_03967 [Carabus blaptoides fortunei]